jgi:alkanesulfonate monooxygenase SsuD/methylene tetrahydromethanopterin reductase-like flavin-dependent oxidoreductase (luciferase family)
MAPRIEPATVPVIASVAEAIRVARKFGASIAEGTIERDRSGAVPARELAAVDASGLLGITVPRKYGGAEVPATVLAEVVRVIAAVDPAIAQVSQSHFLFVDVLAVLGTPSQRRYQLIVDLARHDDLTVRQLIGRLGGGRGHRTFAGTPERVADTIEEWSAAAAADGFNVMPAALPSGLETFVEEVIPILRKRGLFRTEYVGRTLRDHYGIARPDSQFAVAAARDR